MTRLATLADFERFGFGFRPICRKCWHKGPAIAPAEIAQQRGLSMSTPANDVDRRLVCTECGARAGYLHLLNPQVQAWRPGE